MSKFAEVIVDVPAMQTDQPFTYQIPEEVEKVVEAGMRVEVPFGLGNRHIQGFVVNVKKTSDYQQELKSIVRILDLTPVLNTELLALADYMKKTTFAFKITCLETMLPTVMKAEYQKRIVLNDSTHPIKQQYFTQSNSIDWQEAENLGILNQLKKLRLKNVVELQYVVKKKNKVKMVRYVESHIDKSNLAQAKGQVRKGAKRQCQLLDLLSENAHQPLSFYSQKAITSAALKKGEEQGWLTI